MGRSKTNKRSIAGADIFAVKMPDGRYRAFRVLRTGGKISVVCTTPYLRAEIPELGDPALLQVLHRSFFAWENEPSIQWFAGYPPERSILVGNIPLSQAEQSIVCKAYGGAWGERVGLDVYYQWRWDHDRDAFVEEAKREQQERYRRLREQADKPRKMMSDDSFWHVISLLDWSHQGDDEKVIEPAVRLRTQE